jgi:hypothetical protein
MKTPQRFQPGSLQRIYWLRAPHAVMVELRSRGFHDGYWRDPVADEDNLLQRIFSAATPRDKRPEMLLHWATIIEREACLLNPGYATLWHPGTDPQDESIIRSVFGARLVEIAAQTASEALHSFSLTPWALGIVYHVACMGNWREVVAEQFVLLKSVGLTGVHTVLLGSDSDLREYEELSRLHRIETHVEFHHPDLELFEVPAIRFLQDWAECHDGYVMYFHTKGVSAPQDPWKIKWRHLMNREVIARWRSNIDILQGGHDIVGVNWRDTPPISHFAGNFWIAKASFIRTLEDFSTYYRNPRHQTSDIRYMARLGCEFWIGSGATRPRMHSHVSWNEPNMWTGDYYRRFGL